MDIIKKINIKTNTIKRYMKDLSYYKKELESLEAKHKTTQSDPDACPHVLKKQDEVIKETAAMIPDCEARLEAARADLKEFLDNHSETDDVSSSEAFKEARLQVC